MNDLLSSGRRIEVIDDVRIGKIHFQPLNRLNYRQFVKSHLHKVVTEKIVSLQFAKLYEQTGIVVDSIRSIDDSWNVKARGIWFIGTYLTICNARKIFVELPNIKSKTKKLNKYQDILLILKVVKLTPKGLITLVITVITATVIAVAVKD